MKIVRKKKSNIIPIKKKRKKKRLKVLGFLLLATATFVSIMLTPLFNTKWLDIQGNEKVTDDQIIQALNFKYGENIFKMRISDCEDRIRQYPYIDTVSVKRKLPGGVSVTVTERTPAAYMAFAGAYVLIDRTGKLLESTPEIDEDNLLPVVSGIDLQGYQIGTSLSEKNPKEAEAFQEIYSQLEQYGLLERVSSFDISDAENVTFVFDGNKRVEMGESSQTDYKLMMLKAAIEGLSKAEAGTIDLSIEGKAVFSPGKDEKPAAQDEQAQDESPSADANNQEEIH